LRTIASEGRKFGLGLMVISQRPARIDKNVLSQCNTQIIMKVTNPNDLKAISKGLEGISSEVEEELKRLPPGVAMRQSHPGLRKNRLQGLLHVRKNLPRNGKVAGCSKRFSGQENENKNYLVRSGQLGDFLLFTGTIQKTAESAEARREK
jgi:hypothetical protein